MPSTATADSADASASREVLEAYRLVAADAGWLRRVGEVILGGLSAEAAVQRVAGELRDRMRRITDPYLRERLADLEDLAGRLMRSLSGHVVVHEAVPLGAIYWTGMPAASLARRSRRPARPVTPRSWLGHSIFRCWVAPAAWWMRPVRRTRRCWTAMPGN